MARTVRSTRQQHDGWVLGRLFRTRVQSARAIHYGEAAAASPTRGRAHAHEQPFADALADPSDLAAERAVLRELGGPRLGDLIVRRRRELAPGAAVLAVLLAASLGHLAAAWAWWLPLLVAGAGTAAWVRWRANRRPERVYVALVGGAAGLLAAIGWALDVSGPWFLALLVAGLAAAVPWWRHVLPRDRVKAGPREVRRQARRALEAWPIIAPAIGLAGSRVQSIDPDSHGWTMRLRLPAGKVVRDVVAKVEHLESGLRVRPGAVRVQRDEARADRAHVRVNLTDPLGKSIDWPGPSGSSIAEPIRLGQYEDREPVLVRLVGGHVLLAGGTGSGKSATQRVLLAELLSRRDVVVWAVDVAKRGLQFLPFQAALHRLAVEPADAVAMLRAALAVQRARAGWMAANGLLEWPLGPGAPQLVVLLDELSDLLTIPDVAELLEALAKLGREQGVTLIGATQRASADALGGSAVARTQFGVRIALRCRERRDGDLVLGEGRSADGWRPDRLSAPGSLLLLSDDHQAPIPGRSYWLGAAEARAMAADVLDSRAQLDAVSAEAAGVVVDAAPLPLDGTAPVAPVAALPAPAEARADPRPAAPERRMTAEDRVLAIVRANGSTGVAAGELEAALADLLSRRSVYAALRKLADAGAIAKREDGRWVAVAIDDDDEATA